MGGRGLKDVICQGLGVANCQDEPGSFPGLKAVTVLAVLRTSSLHLPECLAHSEAQFEWKLVLRQFSLWSWMYHLFLQNQTEAALLPEKQEAV